MNRGRVDSLARSLAETHVTRRGATTTGLVVGLGLASALGGVPSEGLAKRANRRDHRQKQRQNKRQMQRSQAQRTDVDATCGGVRPFCLLPLETGFVPVGAIPSGTVSMCFSWRYFDCQTCAGTELSVYDAECNATYADACGGKCTTDPNVRATSAAAE
jgi:hypothetical protein